MKLNFIVHSCKTCLFNKLSFQPIKCFKFNPFSSTYFSTNNGDCAVDLSYTIFHPEKSNSSCIPIIILHGLLGSKQNWRSLGKVISNKTGLKVYTLDARNHGDSPHTDKMNYIAMAKDIKHFMKSHNITCATLMGHSMGGRAAMCLALTEPNIINKLIIVDVSPVKLPHDSTLSVNYMSLMEEALKNISGIGIVQARRKIDDFLSKTITEPGIRQFLLTNLTEKDNKLMWKPNLHVLQNSFKFGIMDFPKISGTFFNPTLFICGGNSPYVKPEDYPYIKTLFPKTEFVVIPGAGHWVHSEKPMDFVETLDNFL